jgi:MOSC domain-containing protein YiiM
MINLQELMSRFASEGEITWLGVRPQRGAPMITPTEVELRRGEGLVGDRYSSRRTDAPRQVTLIQAEHLAVIAALVGASEILPSQLRRNIVVSGINLLSLVNRSFRVGGARLTGTGRCQPCSKMEKALGQGGFNAVRGHGGITASVLEDGIARIGDPVVPEQDM